MPEPRLLTVDSSLSHLAPVTVLSAVTRHLVRARVDRPTRCPRWSPRTSGSARRSASSDQAVVDLADLRAGRLRLHDHVVVVARYDVDDELLAVAVVVGAGERVTEEPGELRGEIRGVAPPSGSSARPPRRRTSRPGTRWRWGAGSRPRRAPPRRPPLSRPCASEFACDSNFSTSWGDGACAAVRQLWGAPGWLLVRTGCVGRSIAFASDPFASRNQPTPTARTPTARSATSLVTARPPRGRVPPARYGPWPDDGPSTAGLARGRRTDTIRIRPETICCDRRAESRLQRICTPNAQPGHRSRGLSTSRAYLPRLWGGSAGFAAPGGQGIR